MTDGKRPYRKKVRAEQEEQTRLRITESAVALHGSRGPARTSLSAIAEHAGVRRSTLYRHFPDEEAVFEACSAHWGERNPPPDPSAWPRMKDPDERLRAALEALYAYYGRTAGMIANLLRDEETVPFVKARFGAYHGYLATVVDVLMAGRGLRGRTKARVRAAVGHALAFHTWSSLVREQGLDDNQAADLMCRLVVAAKADRA
jgi:AcrR family transcriptional regulator